MYIYFFLTIFTPLRINWFIYSTIIDLVVRQEIWKRLYKFFLKNVKNVYSLKTLPKTIVMVNLSTQFCNTMYTVKLLAIIQRAVWIIRAYSETCLKNETVGLSFFFVRILRDGFFPPRSKLILCRAYVYYCKRTFVLGWKTLRNVLIWCPACRSYKEKLWFYKPNWT